MDSLTNRAVCPNCATEISGPFCPSCGQEQKELKKFFWTMAGDAFDDVFQPDSRASRSLFALIFRPGFLTTEYFAGRRARYVPPIRLYLVISFLFFFILPLLSEVNPEGPDHVITTDDPTETSNWRDDINAETSNINLGWLTEDENKKLSEKLKKQVEKTVARFDEDPSALFTEFMDLLSAVMFFLLPVFAIFLKLFYIGSGIYYAEHLLLAIHNHCFLFIALLLSSLLELAQNTAAAVVTNPLDTALSLWIPIYIYLSMRKVYQQGHVVTLFKFSVLALSYWMLALVGFVTAVIFGVMML